MSDPTAGPPRSAIGPYQVVRELGRGGMGVVYEVENPQLKKRCALKALHVGEQISPELVARFRREAEALARIDRHDGIVSVADVGEADGLLYFTMELVTGGDLDELLTSADVSPQQAAELTAGIADALEHAHRNGIIHRDLKPANVLLTPDGTPKLTDFGLAHDTQHATRLTTSGVAMGTPVYMSPEQASGKTSAIDARTDVYAAGAVLYELLTNAPPFDGDSSASVIMQVIARDPRPARSVNPTVPAELEAICVKAMEKDPAKRYQSAAMLREDLRAWRDGRPITAKPIGKLGWMWRRAKRNPVALGGVVVALLAVGGSAAWGVVSWSRAEAVESARTQRAADALPLIKEGDRLAEQAERFKYIRGIERREIESTLEEADAKYTAALAIDDTNATVWLARGRVREQRIKLEQALDDFDRAIRLQSELGAAHVGRATLLATLTSNKRPINISGRVMNAQGRFSGTFRCSRELKLEGYEALAQRAQADLDSAARLGVAEAELLAAKAALAFAVSEDPDYTDALRLHEAAVAADPTNVDARVDLARTLYSAHRFAEALTEAEATAKMAPNYFWAQQSYANALYYNERWPEAVGAFRQALTFVPNNFPLRRDLAHALMEQGRFEDAAAAFEAAAKLDGERSMPLQGMCLMVLERYGEAEAAFRRSLSSGLRSTVAKHGLAVMYLRMERASDALPMLDELIDRDPEDSVNVGMRALAHRLLGDAEAAESDFQRALALAPDSVANLRNYSVFCSTQGRPAQALELGKRAITLVEDDAGLWRNLGEFHRESKQPKAAIPCFEKALELEPGHAATQTALAKVCIMAGDARRALDLLRASNRARPNNAETLRYLGRALFETGDRAAAAEALDAAVAAAPDFAPAYIMRGLMAAQSGRVAAALTDFKKAVALDPSQEDAHSNRATAARSSGDLAEFSSAASDWLAALPESPAAHANMGLLHFMQREYRQAAAKFRDALARNPGEMAAWYHKSVGDALRNAGEFADAAAAYDAALQLDPKFLQALLPKGIALLEAGQPEAALAIYEQCYALDPATRAFLKPYAARAKTALSAAGHGK